MKKKLPVIVGLLAVILFSLWYGFTDKTHKIYDNNVNTATYLDLGVLTEGQVLSQTFTSEENVLDAFLIKCGPSGDYGNTEVHLTVKDAETGEVLSTGEEIGSNIRPRRLHKFSITPLTGCKGKALVLEMTEVNATVGNGIDLYYQPNETSIGTLTLDGNPLPGVFVMKTVTERFDTETFLIILVSILFIWGFLWFLYRLFK